MAVECSASLTRVSMRPLLECGDSAAMPPACSSRAAWTVANPFGGIRGVPLPMRDQQHGGRFRGPHRATAESAAACARRAFDAYLCGLEARADDGQLRPADWAFGAEPATVGKSVARMAMRLYLSASAAMPPFRPTLSRDALREWQWRPERGCPASDAAQHDESAWLQADVCGGGTAGGHSRDSSRAYGGSGPPHARLVGRLLQLVRGNSSGRWRPTEDPMWVATAGGGKTLAGLWVAGQIMRHVRASIGPCTRALVEELVRDARARLARHAPPGATNSSAHLRWRIGVQMRRGDACERWAGGAREARGREAKERRPCYGAQAYLRAARSLVAILRRQARSPSAASETTVGMRAATPLLLLATDSPDAASELRALVTPGEFEVVAAGGRRGSGWGGVGEAPACGRPHEAAAKEFIEERNRRGLIDRAAVVGTFFADLELLSTADAFVGTSASWTSRAILLSIIGERGIVPPFAMVDGPLKQLWFA